MKYEPCSCSVRDPHHYLFGKIGRRFIVCYLAWAWTFSWQPSCKLSRRCFVGAASLRLSSCPPLCLRRYHRTKFVASSRGDGQGACNTRCGPQPCNYDFHTSTHFVPSRRLTKKFVRLKLVGVLPALPMRGFDKLSVHSRRCFYKRVRISITRCGKRRLGVRRPRKFVSTIQ